MINRDDIEEGDKCFTRDGGCLVAYEDRALVLGGWFITNWEKNGMRLCTSATHPLDIIRIEKAPKPVVEERYISSDDGESWFMTTNPVDFEHIIKLTIINGKLEKSEQVK